MHAHGQVFRFGEFVLDVTAYDLRRRDRPVRIERLPMELLIWFVAVAAN